MDEFLDNFANLDTLLEVWPLLLSGLGVTAMLCIVIVITVLVYLASPIPVR